MNPMKLNAIVAPDGESLSVSSQHRAEIIIRIERDGSLSVIKSVYPEFPPGSRYVRETDVEAVETEAT